MLLVDVGYCIGGKEVMDYVSKFIQNCIRCVFKWRCFFENSFDLDNCVLVKKVRMENGLINGINLDNLVENM